jgi:hypothetical protein
VPTDARHPFSIHRPDRIISRSRHRPNVNSAAHGMEFSPARSEIRPVLDRFGENPTASFRALTADRYSTANPGSIGPHFECSRPQMGIEGFENLRVAQYNRLGDGTLPVPTFRPKLQQICSCRLAKIPKFGILKVFLIV